MPLCFVNIRDHSLGKTMLKAGEDKDESFSTGARLNLDFRGQSNINY